MSATDTGRSAAILQIVAERLRNEGIADDRGALEACSDAIEAVAATLILGETAVRPANG